jgi:hypothetical protein
MNRLLITRRTVALDRTEEYLALWALVATAVVAAGGRTWLFRGSARQDQAMEFVEDQGDGVLEDGAVLSARRSLRESFPSVIEEEWSEWTEPGAELATDRDET